MMQFITDNPVLVVSAYFACAMLIQAVAIIVGVWVGSKLIRNEPLVERKEKYMDVPLFPEEKPLEFEIEEPPISWKSRMTDYGEEESD